LVDNPEVFGMHENANITYQNQESEKIVSTILSIQPRVSGGAGILTPDEIVMERAKEIKKGLPALLDKG
jgi:dynein heavy chain